MSVYSDDKLRRSACRDRDVRYDGLFFSAVKTTRIYCRTICPAGPPLESNVGFSASRTEAEQAGFRPCLRCRPELAPDRPLAKTAPWPIRRVLERIHRGRVPGRKPNDFEAIVGARPSAYRRTIQTSFAKMILTDTALPEEEIAALTGFDGPAQMLDVLTSLYRRNPVKSRKPLPVRIQPGLKSCALMLAYRQPYDWSGLLGYFRVRAVAGLETVSDDTYQRTFLLNSQPGWLSLSHKPERNALRLEIHASDLSGLMELVWRVRRMFDLDADPMTLDSIFGQDPLLGATWRSNPGLRVPVCFDAFEFAVRAVAGQLISVTAATMLVGRIVQAFGEDAQSGWPTGLEKIFPTLGRIHQADLSSLGLTRTKATAVTAVAQPGIGDSLNVETDDNLDAFVKRIITLHGIGEWTAQTLAMRGLGDPDAFPAADLGIVKALSRPGQKMKPRDIVAMAEQWRPWRSYAAMLLWAMGHNQED